MESRYSALEQHIRISNEVFASTRRYGKANLSLDQIVNLRIT